MRCPLCGCEFDEKQVSCHASCALNEYCTIICCPNCGYQMADESKSRLAAGMNGLLGRLRKGKRTTPGIGTICPLSALRAGDRATVISIDSQNAARVERLNIFGLTPGAMVTLEQRYPEMVLRIGFTDLSVEQAVANEILVERA